MLRVEKVSVPLCWAEKLSEGVPLPAARLQTSFSLKGAFRSTNTRKGNAFWSIYRLLIGWRINSKGAGHGNFSSPSFKPEPWFLKKSGWYIFFMPLCIMCKIVQSGTHRHLNETQGELDDNVLIVFNNSLCRIQLRRYKQVTFWTWRQECGHECGHECTYIWSTMTC